MSTRTTKEIYNQRLIIGITTSLLVLCYYFYFLRILSRKLLQTPLWIDDWFMLFALCVCSGQSVLNYIGVAYGSGVHRDNLEASQYRHFQISLYVFMMFWALAVTVVKIGILLFYWRIFIVHDFRRRVTIVGAIILTSGVAIFLSFMFQCNPIPRFWVGSHNGYCINQVAFYISAGSINIASDVLVLSLPMQQVWKLNASIHDRAALTFLFCLGGFVCITSILRIIALNDIDPEDFSFTNVRGGLWSTVEPQVGFICANLPHTRPLIIRWYQRWRPRTLARASANDHPNSFNAQSRSLRDTVGFQSLDSQSRSTATVAGSVVKGDASSEHIGREEAGIGAYEPDHELDSIDVFGGSNGTRIKVQTEMRQEVQRMKSLDTESKWANDMISTKISANSNRPK